MANFISGGDNADAPLLLVIPDNQDQTTGQEFTNRAYQQSPLNPDTQLIIQKLGWYGHSKEINAFASIINDYTITTPNSRVFLTIMYPVDYTGTEVLAAPDSKAFAGLSDVQHRQLTSVFERFTGTMNFILNNMPDSLGISDVEFPNHLVLNISPIIGLDALGTQVFYSPEGMKYISLDISLEQILKLSSEKGIPIEAAFEQMLDAGLKLFAFDFLLKYAGNDTFPFLVQDWLMDNSLSPSFFVDGGLERLNNSFIQRGTATDGSSFETADIPGMQAALSNDMKAALGEFLSGGDYNSFVAQYPDTYISEAFFQFFVGDSSRSVKLLLTVPSVAHISDNVLIDGVDEGGSPILPIGIFGSLFLLGGIVGYMWQRQKEKPNAVVDDLIDIDEIKRIESVYYEAGDVFNAGKRAYVNHFKSVIFPGKVREPLPDEQLTFVESASLQEINGMIEAIDAMRRAEREAERVLNKGNITENYFFGRYFAVDRDLRRYETDRYGFFSLHPEREALTLELEERRRILVEIKESILNEGNVRRVIWGVEASSLDEAINARVDKLDIQSNIQRSIKKDLKRLGLDFSDWNSFKVIEKPNRFKYTPANSEKSTPEYFILSGSVKFYNDNGQVGITVFEGEA